MNKGIEILLERMKSNPEEFVEQEGYGSKWSGIVAMYKDALDPEDYEAFASARRKLIQDQFTAEVMKELLDPKSGDGVTLTSISHPRGMHSGGVTLGAYSNTTTATLSASGNLTTNSLTLGKTTVDETALHQLLHMKAQMELEKAKVKAEQAKKSKTLFGRLFNYQ